MKTLHLYLTRQVLATLLMTVCVFTFVLLLGEALKAILELLINRQATIWGVVQAFGLLLPWVLAFALPMGMLMTALLVFGRFSADQELTAVRSSGISLLSLITPVLVLSLLLCGLSAWINLQVAPHCRVVYKHIVDGMKARVAAAILPEGRYSNFPGGLIYVEKNDGQELGGIKVLYTDKNGEFFIIADRGVLDTNDQQQVTLHLLDAKVIDKLSQQSWGTLTEADHQIPLDVKKVNQGDNELDITDMTFHQLRAKLHELDDLYNAPTLQMTSDETRQYRSTLEEQKAGMTMPILVQIHWRVAFSFACFSFTLIGIPLGIRAHRRETIVGFAMALVLVLIYYSFLLACQSLKSHEELAPHLIVWLPNFILQTVGAVMLWRANRGV